LIPLKISGLPVACWRDSAVPHSARCPGFFLPGADSLEIAMQRSGIYDFLIPTNLEQNNQ
jgi:hypothetical protein